MAMRLRIANEGIDLQSLARKAKADAARGRAAALLASWAREDEDLFHAIMDGQLEKRCQLLITTCDDNRDVHTPTYQPTEPRDNEDLLAAGILLTFALPNGRLLGMASLVDLEAAQGHYLEQAARAHDRIRFISLVKKRLKRGQVVEDVLTEAGLRALMRQAQAETETAAS